MYLLRKIWQRLRDPIFYRKKVRQILQIGKSWNDDPVVRDITSLGQVRRAVVVVAHPDDETFCAGLIGQLNDACVSVSVVCLTRGEGGPTGNFPREELGKVREAEMRKSCAILGVEEVHFLDHVDPVAGRYRVYAPAVSVSDLASQLRPFLDNADLVVSHGSHGEYWHPAHLMVFDAVRKSVSGNAEVTWLTFLARHPDHPIPHLVNWEDPVFLQLAVSDRKDQRSRAIECHESQLGLFGRFAGGTWRDFVAKTSIESYSRQQVPRDLENG